MILAVDFDGTLCRHNYPDFGTPYKKRIESLIKLRAEGNKLILWTCRNGDLLQEAIEWCQTFGLEFDAVNDDLPEVKISSFGVLKSVKVLADIYLDDRNIDLYDFLGE